MVNARFDVLIIGGGILGVTTSYWVSNLYHGKIALVEKESEIALHQSLRNTNVLHRPFYLNPVKKRLWSFSAQASYSLWRRLASADNLPWKDTGTIEVAKSDGDIETLERYRTWATANGMKDEEIEIIDSSALTSLEPQVKGKGAIFSKTDASVDFRKFTLSVFQRAKQNGVVLIDSTKAKRIDNNGVLVSGKVSGRIDAKVIINCSAGGTLKLAHDIGLARDYTNLFFRGDYWQVNQPLGSRIRRNIYTVPAHSEYPFLDPHFIVRYDGRREVGPTATLVSNPYSYREKYFIPIKIWRSLLSRPATPKMKLLFNKEFRGLASEEWKSSISRKTMAKRVSKFIPDFKKEMLTHRGISGVRTQIIDGKGTFVPEALVFAGNGSVHIINYNSPGATGAPAFSELLVYKMDEMGFFEGIKRKTLGERTIWEENDVIDKMPETIISSLFLK